MHGMAVHQGVDGTVVPSLPEFAGPAAANMYIWLTWRMCVTWINGQHRETSILKHRTNTTTNTDRPPTRPTNMPCLRLREAAVRPSVHGSRDTVDAINGRPTVLVSCVCTDLAPTLRGGPRAHALTRCVAITWCEVLLG